MTEPTDNELDIVLSKHWPAFATVGTLPLIWIRAAFREAIAKWGAPSAAADLIAALEEARSAINSMKVEAETAAQGDEQMMLEACETISNEGLQADMAIRAALASAPKPSPAPQADSQPAPVRDYPPLPDFDTVEQHIYGACRRYITQDMLEPIHNLIRDAIDADRAAQQGK